MKDLDRAKIFIDSADWIFAKTYAETAPHEYIVKNRLPKEKWAEFEFLVQSIFSEGTDKFFYQTPVRYLIIDNKRYWVMDKTVETTVLINRCDNDKEYK